MYTDYDIYVAFRAAQANSKGKAFRLPSDWETFKKNRMSKVNFENLTKITGYFNTKWSNLNIDTYMECGFTLYKTFSYTMFFNRPVIDLYIENDKQLKRRIKKNKKNIDTSFNIVNSIIGINTLNGYNKLQMICKLKEGEQKKVIDLYLHNKFDSLLFVYCIYYKYIKLTDIEREQCYNIVGKYRDLLQLMLGEIEEYIRDKENEFNTADV